jgi:hypothetical protein
VTFHRPFHRSSVASITYSNGYSITLPSVSIAPSIGGSPSPHTPIGDRRRRYGLVGFASGRPQGKGNGKGGGGRRRARHHQHTDNGETFSSTASENLIAKHLLVKWPIATKGGADNALPLLADRAHMSLRKIAKRVPGASHSPGKRCRRSHNSLCCNETRCCHHVSADQREELYGRSEATVRGENARSRASQASARETSDLCEMYRDRGPTRGGWGWWHPNPIRPADTRRSQPLSRPLPKTLLPFRHIASRPFEKSGCRFFGAARLEKIWRRP